MQLADALGGKRGLGGFGMSTEYLTIARLLADYMSKGAARDGFLERLAEALKRREPGLVASSGSWTEQERVEAIARLLSIMAAEEALLDDVTRISDRNTGSMRELDVKGDAAQEQRFGAYEAATGSVGGLAGKSPTGIVEQGDIRFGRRSEAAEGRLPLLRRDRTDRCKLLFIAASAADQHLLHINEELRDVTQAIERSPRAHLMELSYALAFRCEELQEALIRHRPRILHISAHGDLHSGLLFMQDSQRSRLVAADPLVELLALFRDHLDCVVLNACHTRSLARSIAERHSCAVGMAGPISDQAAIRFASSFYSALGYGKDVEVAFSLASAQVGVEYPAERHIPHLEALGRTSAIILVR